MQAVQEAVIGAETMWVGLVMDETGSLGWGHIIESLTHLVEDLQFICSEKSLGGFKQEMEISIVIKAMY